MSEPAQKCNNYAIFKKNYTLQMFIALKMLFWLTGKSRFSRLPPKNYSAQSSNKNFQDEFTPCSSSISKLFFLQTESANKFK